MNIRRFFPKWNFARIPKRLDDGTLTSTVNTLLAVSVVLLLVVVLICLLLMIPTQKVKQYWPSLILTSTIKCLSGTHQVQDSDCSRAVR